MTVMVKIASTVIIDEKSTKLKKLDVIVLLEVYASYPIKGYSRFVPSLQISLVNLNDK